MNYAVVILIVLVLAGILVFVLAGRKNAGEIKRQDKERVYVKTLSEFLSGAADSCRDPGLKKEIRGLMDLAESSPYRSSEEVKDLEKNALDAAAGLAGAVAAGDSEEIREAIEETGRLIRMRNHRLIK